MKNWLTRLINFPVALSLSLGSTALLLPGPAQAQQLEEVLVSARKVEETLQEVPVSVSVWNAKALKQASIYALDDLNAVSPSFYMNTSYNKVASSPIQVRGIGTIGTNPGFEGAVGVFVDGAYRSRPGMALQSFNDLDSIELLRGPQGTLFGKNTVAGALLLHSAVPSPEFEARLEVEGGDFDHRKIRALLNGSLGDNMVGRVSALNFSRDGFYTNPNTGNDQGNKDSQAIKAQLLWDASQKISVRLIADYVQADERCCYGQSDRWQQSTTEDDFANTLLALRFLYPDTPAYEGPYYNSDVNERKAALNWEGSDETEDKGFLVDANWQINELTNLRSITSIRRYDNDQMGNDADFGPVDLIANYEQTYSFETFTQEFNLTGSHGDLSYIAGLYYSDESLEHRLSLDSGIDMRTLFGFLDPSLPIEVSIDPNNINPLARAANTRFKLDDKVAALYAQLEYQFTDFVGVIGGIRYSNEEKSLDRTNLLGGGSHEGYGNYLFNYQGTGWAVVPATGPDVQGRDHSDDQLSYNLGLQLFFNQDTQAFLSYTTGSKAGGFSLNNSSGGGFWVAATSPVADLSKPHPTHGGDGMYQSILDPADNPLEYGEETVESVELGLKASYLKGRGRLNVAVFSSQFDDIQINQYLPTPPQFVTYNAEKATSEGLELETSFAFTQGFVGTLSVTKLWDRSFGDKLSNPLANDPVTGFEGDNLPHAPEWAGFAGLNYEHTFIGDSHWFASVNVFYKGEHTQNTGAIDNQDGAVNPTEEYTLVSSTVGIRSNDGNWEVSLRCANCTDELYSNDFSGQPFYDQISANRVLTRPGDPRTWVAAISYSFR